MEYGAGSAAAGGGAGGGPSIFVAAEGPDGGGSCPADFIISVPATAMATIAASALAILTMFQPRSVLLLVAVTPREGGLELAGCLWPLRGVAG